ncbi:2Fe-2S iron-sulfur cluster binding domain-containing protein [Bacillus sp. V3B]|uniref:NADH:ubiquinone reductase (Na(+)-transporting) subunit F n=1 Tax=Bacillus sp. V3B TaxID=2804915 RepID=UPI0021086DB3|nr:2Fe-2S iron-sulfur cluster binding domain-containing protein [Bacillus sp. V3B]MCQ6274912.1 2Fe-2S iron-sulfur cluster binding domain-containing protein [Bacillus sp. V3B]
MTKTAVETYEITLEPSGKTITVKEGQTLLDAAIRNGVQVAYGCRHGSCSACKCQVLEGDYEIMDRVSEYSLMSFEREEGFTLMCSTLVESDLVIEVEEEESELPFFAVHDFEAEVVENVACTHDIHMIKLKLQEPENVEYASGQFFEFDIPEFEDTRAYSLANKHSNGNILEFHIKRVPEGKGSNYMCDLQAGDVVTGSGPYGSMQLRNRDKDLIFIAGGSGMAPIKSLLEELFSQSFEKNAWFFYGARAKKDLYLTEEWEALAKQYPNFHFVPALSQPGTSDNWDGETGFIADVISRTLEDTSNMDAYLCGPPIMIETACDALYKSGIKGTNISYDEF